MVPFTPKPITPSQSVKWGYSVGRVGLRLTTGKGKGRPVTYQWRHRRELEAQLYSCITLALNGRGWLRPSPGRLTPGKETRWAPRPVWVVWSTANLLTPPEFEPPPPQPVESLHTDNAIAVLQIKHRHSENNTSGAHIYPKYSRSYSHCKNTVGLETLHCTARQISIIISE